ncbi:PQQ-binding-like beta-propeller repeat protein [Halorhabdus sp. BNX81]|uniref:outer membrane protein assembly factor BamB family protein n=1 Tax=Halorhabdus sp. BNX81 TaxID=2980181 RepID=UPI0023DD2929|nr:PQQ-binding-like beta-propeller repeat protein [Halorhabdus sp. BNX81]WEL20431.1 Secreted protein, with PKD repeat domain [Halorhabdus sp. BNX81]
MNRRQFGLASIGALTTSLAGCGQLDAVLGGNTSDGGENWGAYRGDVARTGRIAAEEGPGESLSVAWQLRYEDIAEEVEDIDLSNGLVMGTHSTWPLLADDLLIWGVQFQSRNNERPGETYMTHRRLVATDTSGAIKWSRELPVLANGNAVPYFGHRIDDGQIYQPTVPADYRRDATDAEGETAPRDSLGVTVLDPETGETERELDLGLSSAGNMIVDDGRIFVEISVDDTDERGLYAFDAESGAEKWAVDTMVETTAPFGSLAGDTIIYARETEEDEPTDLLARNIDDGDLAWDTPLDISGPHLEPVSDPLGFTLPTIAEDIYTAGSRQGSGGWMSPLVALDTEDGAERSRYRPPGIEGENHPYLELSDVTEQNVDELPPASGVYGMPLPMDDLVVATGYGAFGGNDDPETFHCFAIEDGSLAWSVEIGETIGIPVAAGDVIYDTSTPGVKAISTEGDVLDSVNYAEHNVSISWSATPNPPAIGNGLLYVPVGDGIIAIE